jgi:hypothetical protein
MSLSLLSGKAREMPLYRQTKRGKLTSLDEDLHGDGLL